MPDLGSHWQSAYLAKAPEQVSWFQPVPERSLALIAEAGLPPEAPIVDVGGGASRLAGELLRAGRTDVTVVDISAAALGRARAELGDDAARIEWVEADVRALDLGRAFDLWHDRGVFHFMVEPADRDAYVAALRGALRHGGHLVLAAFGPDGPPRCSGLPVRRYGPEELSAVLGPEFTLCSSGLETHTTPAGVAQQFVYAHFRRAGHATVDELLAEARAGLDRVSPAEAAGAMRAGALLIDIRSESQRARDGEIPGAAHVPRNVLEWRLDPSCEHRDPALARRDIPLLVICDEGYQSSLAAATLRRLGLRATDVAGGFQAWRLEGLPVEHA